MSIENELITVVVCVRNRAPLLAEMLESLRRQRVRGIPGTHLLLKPFYDVKY